MSAKKAAWAARRRAGYAFVGGLFLAVLQFSFFLLLEWQLSSAWITYASVTIAWMAGFFLGLFLKPGKRGKDEILLALCLGAYYCLWTSLRLMPFDFRPLPVYAACVLCAGLYAGWFFRSSFPRMENARELLLHENNGFVFGLLAAFYLFSHFGSVFLAAAPAALAALLWAARQAAFPSRKDA